MAIVKRGILLVLQEHEADVIIEALHAYVESPSESHDHLAHTLIDQLLDAMGRSDPPP